MPDRWLREENICNIGCIFSSQAQKIRDRTALVYMGRKISYGSLLFCAERVGIFVGRNSMPNERVAIWMPNIPQFVMTYYGIMYAGQTAVPINFISIANDLKARSPSEVKVTEEIVAQFQDAKPSLVFIADIFYPIFRQIAIDWPCTVVVASPGEFLPTLMSIGYDIKTRKERKARGPMPADVVQFGDILKNTEHALPWPKQADAVAQFQYTGGTTGVPKGAMLTHRNLISNVLQAREFLGDLLNDDGEVMLGALPFFHIYGLTVCMNTTLLSLGGTLVLIPAFSAKAAIEAIDKYKVTVFPGVNRMYQALIAHEELMRSADVSSLKLCISGAGPIDRSICEKFHELTGTAIVEGYGLSETSPIVSVTLPQDADRPKAGGGNLLGKPVPETLIRIVDENGAILPAGEIGEIVVSGPQVMQGYYNHPEATADVLCDGWLRTGDVGYCDSEGYLYFTDRNKDVIKVMGENVFASHIEKELMQHPELAEVVVLGFPDAKRGEIPVAVVVFKVTDPPPANVTARLSSWLRERGRLSHLQMPAKIIVFKTLEEFKNPIGKVLKRRLKEEVSCSLSIRVM
jgi:long-chain acyl-CoA synthetase